MDELLNSVLLYKNRFPRLSHHMQKLTVNMPIRQAEAKREIFIYFLGNDLYSEYRILKEVDFMFRIWVKKWKNNHMIKDTVIADDTDDTRTHKVFRSLEEICYQFDLGKPIWLDSNIQDFKKHDKTRFSQDNFIENIDFDYLEIHVIEED